MPITKTLFRPKGGGWIFETPKTKKSTRTIDLPDEILTLLRVHRTQQLQERLVAGSTWTAEHDFVFANFVGAPLHETDVSKNFKKLLTDTKLPSEFRLYDLRHTCATLMLLEGIAAKVVSERLGHSGITLTLDTYSHVLPSMQKEATSKLAARLFGEEKKGQEITRRSRPRILGPRRSPSPSQTA